MQEAGEEQSRVVMWVKRDDYRKAEEEQKLCFHAGGIINAQIAVPCTGCSL